jgi:hypothetical protein
MSLQLINIGAREFGCANNVHLARKDLLGLRWSCHDKEGRLLDGS